MDSIEHDPYVLISILSVLHEGAWMLDQVQGTLENLFDRQYILTEDVVVEVRYRTESRTDSEGNSYKEVSMAVSKSQKIQAEIDKVKAKISEQQARLKELEKNKQEAENSEIVDIVRGMSISLEELPLVLQRLRDGTSGQSVQKSGDGGKEEN